MKCCAVKLWMHKKIGQRNRSKNAVCVWLGYSCPTTTSSLFATLGVATTTFMRNSTPTPTCPHKRWTTDKPIQGFHSPRFDHYPLKMCFLKLSSQPENKISKDSVFHTPREEIQDIYEYSKRKKTKQNTQYWSYLSGSFWERKSSNWAKMLSWSRPSPWTDYLQTYR